MALKDFYTDYLENNKKPKKPSVIPTNIYKMPTVEAPEYSKNDIGSNNSTQVGQYVRGQLPKYGLSEGDFTYKVNPETNKNEFFIGGESFGNYDFNPNDNRTYGNKSDIDSRFKQYAQDNTITPAGTQLGQGAGVNSIVDNNKLTEMYNKLLSKSDEKFSYDPNKDEAYQAAKGQYEQMGDKAYRNTVGGLSDSTMGYASTSNVAAAAQARNAYNERAAALMPQYRDQRYGEFRDARQDERNLFSDAYKMNQDSMEQDKWQRGQQENIANKRYDQYSAGIKSEKEAEQEAYNRAIYGDEVSYNKEQDAYNKEIYQDEVSYNKEQDAIDRRLDEDAVKYGISRDVLADAISKGERERKATVEDRTFAETVRKNKAGESIQWKNAATSARNAETSATKAIETKADSKTARRQKFADDVMDIKSLPTVKAVEMLNNPELQRKLLSYYTLDEFKDIWNEVLRDAIKRGDDDGTGNPVKSYENTFNKKDGLLD